MAFAVDEVGVAGMLTMELLPYALTVIFCGLLSTLISFFCDLDSSSDAERFKKWPICLLALLAMEVGAP